ncbi:MAG: hypothetical protein Q9194_001797 [Teloschistes cf. exilis]
MPGVASGRGCGACRKQKKKACATSNAIPERHHVHDISGSRSSVGQGQQCWKFISKSVDDGANPISNEPQIEAPPLHDQLLAVRPSRSPTNATDHLAPALVYRANPELDIRYQFPWNIGTFLWDIPARLGTNAALDAASDVLVTAHAQYCAGGRRIDKGLLKKQALALSVLRQHLVDPAKALSSETLCATTLLMTSHLLTDPTQDMPYSHVRGAADLLKARGLLGPRDEFEKKLILMLRGPIETSRYP